jgi:hypothetical protein
MITTMIDFRQKMLFVSSLKGVVLHISNSFLGKRENWSKSSKKKKNYNIYVIRFLTKSNFYFYCNTKIIIAET